MKNNIALFDLDRTIFDTDNMMEIFTRKILDILENPKLSDFKDSEQEYLKTLSYDREFIPEDYIKTISKKFNFKNQELLLDVFFGKDNQFIYKESVYPDALKIFKYLKKKKYRLGIFSEGMKKFQNHKFNSLELHDYLDHDLTFIFSKKNNPEALNKIPKSAIIIDDKLSICKFLHKNNISVIWLNKKGLPNSNSIKTIHKLLDLTKIL